MSILFTDVLNAQRNTSVDSSQFVAPSAGLLSITARVPASSVSSLLKNGVDVGQSTAFVAGDIIAIRAVASSQPSDPIQVVMDLDGEPDVWAMVTAPDLTFYLNPKMVEQAPVESLLAGDGSTFFPHPANNRLRMLPDIGRPQTNSTSLGVPVVSESVIESSDVLVCSYHDKRLHVVDSITGQVVRTLSLPGMPYAAVFVARDPNATQKVYDIWVTLSDIDTVLVLSPSGEHRSTFVVGKIPRGIAASPDGRRVYVACAGANTMERFVHTADAHAQRTAVIVGQKPIYVACDADNAYVSCTGSNRVYSVTNAGVVTQINVGDNPHGIAVHGGAVYVAVMSLAQVVRIVAGEVVGTTDVDAAPTSVYTLADGVAVVSGSSARVQKIGANGSVVASSQFQEWPYHVIAAAGKVFVSEMWSGAPSYMYQLDRDVHPFSLDSQALVPRGTPYVTNEFEVRGINAETVMSLSPINGATLMRNGNASGTRTVVAEGDKVAVRFANQTEPDVRMAARLFIGARSSDFDSITTPLDMRPVPFEFGLVTNAVPSSTHTSNDVVIAGLEQDMLVMCSATVGRIFVNDAQQPGLTTQVKNGDRLRISMEASPNESTPVFCTVRVGEYEHVWTVMTRYIAEQTNYMEERYSGQTMFQVVNFAALPEGTVDRTKDKVLRYNKTTFAKLSEFPIAPNGNQGPGTLDQNPLIYAFDPTRRAVDLVNIVTGAVHTTQVYPAIPYGVSAGPMVSMGEAPTDQWVTAPGSNTIWQFNGAKTIPIQAGAQPMGIACSNYNQLFVAGSDGFLYRYNFNEDTDRFVFDTIIGVPGGGRLQDILFDDTQMFVSDLTANQVHVLRSGLYIRSMDTGLLPYSMVQSGTYVYTANFGSASVSMLPKDPALGGQRTVELPAGASLPNCLAYDAANGYLYVGCSRVERVYVLRATTLEVVSVINGVGPVWGLQILGQELIVLNRWGNLFDKLNVGIPRSGPNSMLFGTVNADNVDEAATSGIRDITTRMPRREAFWVEPYSDVEMVIDGAGYPNHSTTVITGNTVELRTRSSEDYNTTRKVRAFSYNHRTELRVVTPIDTFPNDILFATVQNVIVRDRAYSEEKVVSGLGDSVAIRAVPTYDRAPIAFAEVELYIDGLLYVENGVGEPAEGTTHSNVVRNGSRVRLSAKAYGVPWNGERAVVGLENEYGYSFARFAIVTGYLDNAIRRVHKTDFTDGMDAIEWWPRNLWTNVALREALLSMGTMPYAELGAALLNRVSIESVDTSTEVSAASLLLYADASHAVSYGARPVETKDVSQAVLTHVTSGAGVQMIAEMGGSTAGLREILGDFSWVLNTQRMEFGESEVKDAEAPMRSGPVSTSVMDHLIAHRADIASVEPGYLYAEAWNRVEYTSEYEWHKMRTTAVYNTRWEAAELRNVHEYQMTWAQYNQSAALLFNTAYVQAMAAKPREYLATYLKALNRSLYAKGVTYGNRPRNRYPLTGTTFEKTWRTVFPVIAGYGSRYKSGHWPVVVSYGVAAGLRKYSVSTAWDVVAHVVLRPVGVSYIGRLRAGLPSVGTSAVLVGRATAARQVSSSYVSQRRSHFDQFVYSAQDIRAFATEEAARVAGQGSLHPVVYTKKLWDANWMWHVPAEIQRVECANTELVARYVRGYVQGG